MGPVLPPGAPGRPVVGVLVNGPWPELRAARTLVGRRGPRRVLAVLLALLALSLVCWGLWRWLGPVHGPPYDNCGQARSAHAAPMERGAPGYRPALDRDGDGTACE
jgi:hypothetical protein